MEVEIFGGPRDGSLIAVPDGSHSLAVAISPTLSWEDYDSLSPIGPSIRIEEYPIRVRRSDRRHVVVWPIGAD